MKKLLSTLTLFCISLVWAQVNWMTMNEALKAQEKQPKKIIIDFYADWCQPCHYMEQHTFSHPVIAQYLNENYYPVRFLADGNEKVTIYGRTFSNPGYINKKGRKPMHEFSMFMNINALPSLFVLDENSEPITLLQGALTAKELEPYLPFFASDDYKKINSRDDWENYQKKFKSTIKD